MPSRRIIDVQFCNAVGRRKTESVLELLKQNPSKANSEDGYGWTALHLAASLNNDSLCRILIRHGADVLALDSNIETPLDLAVSRGHTRICAILIESGVKVAISHLYRASKNGDADICAMFLAQGLSVNDHVSTGNTPLHGACAFGNVDVIKLLLRCGADITIRNDGNETVFQVAGRSNPKAKNIVLKELYFWKKRIVCWLGSGRAVPAEGFRPNILQLVPTEICRYIADML